MAEEPKTLTAEQLLEQFRQMKVSDLLASTLFTLSQLAYGKLEAATRDLEQAKLAIDAMDALLRLLESTLDEDMKRDFAQVLTNLKLAYADAAKQASAGSTS